MLSKPVSGINELLPRAIDGDKDAENEIFRILSVRFRLFARQKIGDREAADDIAQKACVICLEKYKNETFSVGFDAWAYGVLRMGLKSYFHGIVDERKKTADIYSGDAPSLPAPVDIDPSIESRLIECLEKIIPVNTRYARVINLVYQGYNADEICMKLGVSKNNYYVILNRARSLLWKCLEEGK